MTRTAYPRPGERLTREELQTRYELSEADHVFLRATARGDDAVIYTIVTRQLGPLESAVRRLLQRLDETGAAS